MKAWQDLVQNKDVTICSTLNSEWYLNYGVKIERFDDGTFEVKNTMTSSDHYEDVTPEQLALFINDGWEVGAFSVNTDICSARVKTYSYLLDRAIINDNKPEAERLTKILERNIKKYEIYQSRLENKFASL